MLRKFESHSRLANAGLAGEHDQSASSGDRLVDC